jgi:hypothetical protein
MELRQVGYLQELNRDAGQQNIQFCQIQRVIKHINSHGRGMYLPMLMKNFTLFLIFFYFKNRGVLLAHPVEGYGNEPVLGNN